MNFFNTVLFLSLLLPLHKGFANLSVSNSQDSGYEIPKYTKSQFFVTKGGTKIHFLETGKGTPILLLHGFYANADLNWFRNGLAPKLAENYRVIAPDFRGHGLSDKPKQLESYGDFMWQDMIELMDFLEIEKFHIHGYSMGGSAVTKIIYHHYNRLITASYGGAGIPHFGAYEAEPDPEITPEAKEIEAACQQYVFSNFAHDNEAMKLVQQNAPWLGEEHKNIDLSKVEIPVHAINGEFDKPHSKTIRMEKELKSFSSVILKNRGHLSSVVQGYIPEAYGESLLGFIKGSE